MSVANQANDKLTQLVSLTARIESYLNPNNSKKGEAGKANVESKTTTGAGPSAADTIKESIAIGGMATSLSKLIIATNVLSSKGGVKVKDFLINFSEGIKEASDNLKAVNGEKLITALTGMSKSLLSFALGMAAIAILSPAVALGTVVFVLAIRGILFALKTANDNVGKGAAALDTLMKIGKYIAIFALTMVGIALVAPLFAVGVLIFVLAIRGILLALKLADDNAGKGASALDTLMKIGKYVAIFALTMIGISFLAKQFAIGTLVFILAISAITMVLNQLGKKSIEVTIGITLLRSMVKPLVFFGLVMVVAGFAAQYIAIGALVMGLSIGFIGLAAYTLGKLNKTGEITRGSLILNSLAIPMLAFAAALAIIGSLVEDDPATLALKVAVIGGAIVVLGLAAYVLGQPSVALFAEIGAGVLISLAASLVVFAAALFLLSKADFTKDKTDNLGYAISEIGFALAKFGLVAIPAAIGAAVLIPASLALLPLTAALAIFKTIDWQESDGDSLVNAITSTTQGFAHALDGIGVIGMVKLLAAIPVIALIGGALVSLAVGVKSMATLSFTEMEYDKVTHKLIPKRTVRLTNEEIQAVGPNTSAILNALAGPLTNFGMWASMGTYTFGPFSIGSGYMLKGIEAAAKVGSIISSLAKGVSDMANLNVVDYEVKDGKLVPKTVRKLNPVDFILAGLNTGLILSTLASPLADFGKKSIEGEGLIWGDGNLVKGVEASAKVGNAIASIAMGVANMANLNIVDYVVKNGKLVPVSTRKLIADDFTLAASNVGLILTTLAEPLTTFGKDYKDGSSWFTDSALEAGIEATGKIVDPIAKMADMVLKLAGGQATINEVINPGTKNAKLVAKGVINFADAVPIAIANAKKLLYAFPQVFANLGMYINKYEDEIDTAIEFMPKMSKASKAIVSVSKSYLEITKNVAESVTAGKSPDKVLTGFAMSIKNIGGSFDKMDQGKMTLYKNFASITAGMTKINTPFEKFTKLFGQFTKDMGSFVTVWGAFGKDDTEYFKSYADSLKIIASVDAGKLSATTKAIKEQAQAQADLNNAQRSTNSGAANKEAAGTKNTIAPVKETAKAQSNTQQAAQTAPTASAQTAAGLGAGGVIARLEVTNLYINGKLQK